MIDFLWTGTLIGAVVGFLHMLYVFATRLGRSELKPAKTLWQGIWTWAFWILFGAYVLTFWVVGLIGLGVTRLLAMKRGSA